jgi:hypothetical protein
VIFAKIATALVTLSLLVGTVWMIVGAHYPIAGVTGVLAAFFGFFMVRDIRRALNEQDT